MVLVRDYSDLIEEAEAGMGEDLTPGRRLQGGGDPNREDPWQRKKARGGSYWVSPNSQNYWW